MNPAHVIAFCCTGFVMVGAVLLLLACGSEQRAIPTPSPASHVAADFFPVTIVVEADKGWLTVGSVTRVGAPAGQTEAVLVFEGTVKVIRAGRFDYRLSLTDSEGTTYEDSGGVLLGERQQGENPSYQTSITVPADATFTRLGFWVAEAHRPELSYVIDLPVAGIPMRSP